MKTVTAVLELHSGHLPDQLPVAMVPKLGRAEVPLSVPGKTGGIAKDYLSKVSGIPDSPRGVACLCLGRGYRGLI